MPLSAESIHTDITTTCNNSQWLRPIQLQVPEVIPSFRDLHHTLANIRLHMQDQTLFTTRQNLEDAYLNALDQFFFSFKHFYRFPTQLHCASICLDLIICKEPMTLDTHNEAHKLFSLNFGITNAIRMLVHIPLLRDLNDHIESFLYPEPVAPQPPALPAMPHFSPEMIALFTQPSVQAPAAKPAPIVPQLPPMSPELLAIFTIPSITAAKPAPVVPQLPPMSPALLAIFTQPSIPAAKPAPVVPQLPPMSPALLALFTQPSIPVAKISASASINENLPTNITPETIVAGRHQRAGLTGL